MVQLRNADRDSGNRTQDIVVQRPVRKRRIIQEESEHDEEEELDVFTRPEATSDQAESSALMAAQVPPTLAQQQVQAPPTRLPQQQAQAPSTPPAQQQVQPPPTKRKRGRPPKDKTLELKRTSEARSLSHYERFRLARFQPDQAQFMSITPTAQTIPMPLPPFSSSISTQPYASPSPPSPQVEAAPSSSSRLENIVDSQQEVPTDTDSEDEVDMELEGPLKAKSNVRPYGKYLYHPNTNSSLNLRKAGYGTMKTYACYQHQWREFCNEHFRAPDEPTDPDEHIKALEEMKKEKFFVTPEHAILFMEYQCQRELTKHIRQGCNVRVQIGFADKDGNCRSLKDALAKGKVDPMGRIAIPVPVSPSTLEAALNTITDLWRVQTQNGWISCPSPRTIDKITARLRNYSSSLRYDYLHKDQNQRADCPLKDAYSANQFVKLLTEEWQDPPILNARSTNIRDHFSMAVRHQMILRDEDLRNLRFSECFHFLAANAQTSHRKVSCLVFRLKQGKTNESGKNKYSCTIRHTDVRQCAFSAFAFYIFQLWQSKFKASESRLPDFNRPDWSSYHVLPSRNDPKVGISSSAQISAVNKIYERNKIVSNKKTHGGRHTGSLQVHAQGALYRDIPAAGTWRSKQGAMEISYLSNLPFGAAVVMAQYKDQGGCLARDRVSPPVELQRAIFPWIEDIYGPPGSDSGQEWRRQCEVAMSGADENEPELLGAKKGGMERAQTPKGPQEGRQRRQQGHKAAPSASEPTESIGDEEPGSSSFAADTTTPDTYDTNAIYKRTFLKLLVQCRRIILQDAAVLIHYKLGNYLLEDEVFQSQLFKNFAKQLIEAQEKPQDDHLQQREAVIPVAAGEIRSSTESVADALYSMRTLLEESMKRHEEILKRQEEILKKQGEQSEKNLKDLGNVLLQGICAALGTQPANQVDPSYTHTNSMTDLVVFRPLQPWPQPQPPQPPPPPPSQRQQQEQQQQQQFQLYPHPYYPHPYLLYNPSYPDYSLFSLNQRPIANGMVPRYPQSQGQGSPWPPPQTLQKQQQSSKVPLSPLKGKQLRFRFQSGKK